VKKLLLRPKASEDIDEHFIRIAEDNPVIALEVVSSIEEALKRLQQHPEIGSPRYASTPRLEGLRMWPVPLQMKREFWVSSLKEFWLALVTTQNLEETEPETKHQAAV